MSPGIAALVLLAAVIHVGWNVLLKSERDPLRFAAVANTIAAAVMAPAAFVLWLALGAEPIPARAFLLAGAAGLLEAAYFSFLTTAYRLGDISVVYPIARGTAPLLSVLIGIVILGERLGFRGSVGVATLLAGLLAVRRPWLFLTASARRANPHLTGAVAFAFATGVAIASYSAVDRTGARVTEPWIYASVLSVAVAAALWLRIALIGGHILRLPDVPPSSPDRGADGAPPPSGPHHLSPSSAQVTIVRPAATPSFAPFDRGRWLRAAVVGLGSFVGYGLILFAYRHAPLTAVAPLRESAVVFASGWGILRLRESTSFADAAWRLSGAALVVAGIVLLASDG